MWWLHKFLENEHHAKRGRAYEDSPRAPDYERSILFMRQQKAGGVMGNTVNVASALMNNAAPINPEGLQVFREVTTALISFTVLVLSCWMMLDTYRTASVAVESSQTDPQKSAAESKAKLDAYGRQKDILLYAISLLGTVTGYYLGRVPAELRANTAQSQASSANNAALQATARAAEAVATKDLATKDAASTLRRVLPLISPPREVAESRDAPPALQSNLVQAQREIEALLNRVNAS